MNVDDLGVSPFQETSIFSHIQTRLHWLQIWLLNLDLLQDSQEKSKCSVSLIVD